MSDDGPKESKLVKTPWTVVDKRVYDKLPAEDLKIVADARRAMWSGGFSGLAVGGSCGAVAFAASNRGLALPWLKRKHMLLFILGGAALGSYVGTSVAAQDARHSVGTGARRARARGRRSRKPSNPALRTFSGAVPHLRTDTHSPLRAPSLSRASL